MQVFQDTMPKIMEKQQKEMMERMERQAKEQEALKAALMQATLPDGIDLSKLGGETGK